VKFRERRETAEVTSDLTREPRWSTRHATERHCLCVCARLSLSLWRMHHCFGISSVERSPSRESKGAPLVKKLNAFKRSHKIIPVFTRSCLVRILRQMSLDYSLTCQFLKIHLIEILACTTISFKYPYPWRFCNKNYVCPSPTSSNLSSYHNWMKRTNFVPRHYPASSLSCYFLPLTYKYEHSRQRPAFRRPCFTFFQWHRIQSFNPNKYIK
jgi:hypothetical protein